MSPKKAVVVPEPKPFPLLSVWIVGGLLLVAAFLSWGRLGRVSQKAPEAPPVEQPEVMSESVVDRVAKHIVILQNEEPTIATIQDPETLREQNPEFYRNAKVGDRLLIWSDKAVLYSETDDILISVLPASSIPQQAQAAPAATESEIRQGIDTISVEVRNGTWTPGVGKIMGETLTSKGWQVLKPRDASVKGYETTIVAIQNTNASTTEFVKILASDIGAEIVDNVPTSENAVIGDILVIVGSDSVQVP